MIKVEDATVREPFERQRIFEITGTEKEMEALETLFLDLGSANGERITDILTPKQIRLIAEFARTFSSAVQW